MKDEGGRAEVKEGGGRRLLYYGCADGRVLAWLGRKESVILTFFSPFRRASK